MTKTEVANETIQKALENGNEVVYLDQNTPYDPKRITQAVQIFVPTLEDDQKALYALSNYIVSMTPLPQLMDLMKAAQYSYINDPLKPHEEIALEALTGAAIEAAYAQNNVEMIQLLDSEGLFAKEYTRTQ